MNKTIATIGVLAAGLALVGGAVWAASPGSFAGHGPAQMRGHMQAQGMDHGMEHGKGQGMGRGMMGQAKGQGAGHGAGHGMGQGMGQGMGATMLHGGDATSAEVGDIHALFDSHEAIRRTVTNLPDGIRTLTESDDPKVAETIKRHVADMLTRVAQKRDPGLPIESPALRAIFENYDKIETDVETTETGVIVTQTSADAATVALLQTHAGEVTAFVKDGMEAAHNAMMKRMQGAMPASMRSMMEQMHGRDGSASGMHGTMPAQTMQRMHRMNGAGMDDQSAH